MAHQFQPVVMRVAVDNKRSMSHTEPRMAAFFEISRRAAEAVDEELTQALLGTVQIVGGIEAAQNLIAGDLVVKLGYQPFKPFFPDSRKYIFVVHYADLNMDIALARITIRRWTAH